MAELTTLADVKGWLGVTTSAMDATLTRLIEAAEARIRGICGSRDSFLTATFVETFDGDAAQIIRLKNGPITSITSIVADGVTISSDLYSFNASRGVVGFTHPARSTYWSTAMPSGLLVTGRSFNSPSFGNGFNTVTVTYVAGYANQAAVPADLQQAAVELAGLYFQAMERDPGINSETLGSYSYTKESEFESLQAIMNKLYKYGGGNPI
jgi:hypothetical protein